MKKRIRKTICDRSGSYITEAAVFLPVLIISLCALTLLVRIIGICEEVCFITAEEILETDLQAYKNKITVSLCAELEERMSQEISGDYEVTGFRYLFDSRGVRDLIALEAEMRFRVANVTGIDGMIEFEGKLLTRGFTGLYRRGRRLAAEEFNHMGRSWEVLVFPRYGTRYHVPGCMYVKDTVKKKWRTTSMQKEEAERRGYTPCRICGGAAVV